MTRALLLWNLAPCIPFAVWLLWRRRFVATLILLSCTVLLTYVWPLPPVPMLAALALALSLRRLLHQLAPR